MPIDLSDPKMTGYLPVEEFRAKDTSRSSRRVRDDSDAAPVSMLEIRELFAHLPNFPSDAAAATGGIPVGGLYRTGGTIKIREA